MKKTKKTLKVTTDVFRQQDDLINPLMANPMESVCDCARRLAREEQDAANKEREAEREAFLDTICARHERVRNEDGTYTICGWRWRFITHFDGTQSLVCHDRYKGVLIDPQAYYDMTREILMAGRHVYSVSDLGRALLAFDQQKARIDAEESRSLWSRFLSWFPKKSLHSRLS